MRHFPDEKAGDGDQTVRCGAGTAGPPGCGARTWLREARDRLLKRRIACALPERWVLLRVDPQDTGQTHAKEKRGRRGWGCNCAFNRPRACVAPACASTSCYSCDNNHLSCSKYWASFITFASCLSTRHLGSGLWVAVRERIRFCLAPR